MSGSARLTDRDLQATFIDKDALVESKGAFMITDYSERDSEYKKKLRRESVFTIFLIDGPDAGYEQLLTLGVTAPRQRVGRLVKQRAPRGPIMLEKQTKDKEGKDRDNPLYVFVPVTDQAVIARADKLAEKIATEGLDTGDDDDTPF